MTRALLILANDEVRARAARWVKAAPVGTRVEFKQSQRSTEQNARMWAMLTDVATQLEWHGVKLDTNSWKKLFLDALGQEMRIVPNLAGDGFVSLSGSSSDLSKQEMSEMIELMYAWGSDPAHPVKWSEPCDSESIS